MTLKQKKHFFIVVALISKVITHTHTHLSESSKDKSCLSCSLPLNTSMDVSLGTFSYLSMVINFSKFRSDTFLFNLSYSDFFG